MGNTASQRYRFRQGFTLVELVVVIAILGILAGIAIPRFMDSQASARGAKVVADLRTIDSAANIYYAQTGKYPAAISEGTDIGANGFIGTYLAAWPQPANGNFIITLLKGGTKNYTGITAAMYTLDANGRARYNGHTVEWYLNGGDNSSLIAAINAAAAYIKEQKGYYSGTDLINGIAKIVKEAGGTTQVDAALVQQALAAANGKGTTYDQNNLFWKTDKGAPFFYAGTDQNGNSGWQAAMVEVDGHLYSFINVEAGNGKYLKADTFAAGQIPRTSAAEANAYLKAMCTTPQGGRLAVDLGTVDVK